MKSVARIAKTFHQDPAELLDDNDDFRWAVRMAAHNVIVADAKAADEKGSKVKGSSRVAGSRRR